MSTPEQEQATKPVEEQPAEKKEEDGEEETDENKDDTHVETVGEAMLAPVELETGEEGEEVIWKKRAKLFRFDKDEQMWKERGAGDVKFLRAPEGGSIRLLMRRDGTHKVCANHYVRPDVELKQSVGSDRSWVWTAVSDMADGEPTDDVLAIRFQTAEMAAEFKHEMEQAKTVNEEYEKSKKEKGEL